MVAWEEIVIVLVPPAHLRIAPTQPIRYRVATRTVISAPEAPDPTTVQALIFDTGVIVMVVGGLPVGIPASWSRARILFAIGTESWGVPPSSTTVQRAPSRAASVIACLMFHPRPNSMIPAISRNRTGRISANSARA